MKIAINAGHGIKNDGSIDVGAIGATGYEEYIETSEVSKLVCLKLNNNGVETLFIQDGDLWDVTNQANNWKADYFVSIHCNSFSPDSHGVETFAYSLGGNGERLARSVHEELVPATGLYNRGVKTANFHVLRETNMSACLTEIAFISNPYEESLMKSAEWDDKVSTAIAKGICKFLGIQYSEKVQEVRKVKNIVLTSHGADERASGYLADFLNCPIAFKDAISKNDLDQYENVFEVGGIQVYSRSNFISGTDRYETARKVLNVIANGGKV